MTIKPIWKSPFHSAFTDLCDYRGKLHCCFREATNHVSNDGKLIILSLDYNGVIINKMRLHMPSADLRDPKLSVMPDGKLLLIAYARVHNSQGHWQHSRPLCWFSVDGISWSSHRWFGDKNWWLWRLRWHQDVSYGFAYHRASQSLSLYKGNPLRTFECIKSNALSLATHGLGYPNESDICFAGNQAYAIVRRDADSGSAQLGQANYPFKQWHWHDLKAYIGCPVMQLLNTERALIVGRIWQANGPRTALISLNLKSKKLTLLKLLPSSGDNSYPGIVSHEGTLYVSYYSSHEQQTSNIYLASMPLSDVIEQG